MNYHRHDIKLHREECGGITSWWASVPGHPLRSVGDVNHTTQEDAITYAIWAAKRADHLAEIKEKFRAAHPGKQIYIAYLGQLVNRLPGANVRLPKEGEGEYLFVFPSRKKDGVYHLKDFVKV